MSRHFRDVPAFMLVPQDDGGYIGVERSAPWRTQRFVFDGECVTIADVRVCRESSAATR